MTIEGKQESGQNRLPSAFGRQEYTTAVKDKNKRSDKFQQLLDALSQANVKSNSGMNRAKQTYETINRHTWL